MKRHLLASIAPVVLLSQCVGPYPMDGPFGPGAPRPYSDQREQYRQEAREYDRQQSMQAYDRGLRDGRADFHAGRPKSNTGPERRGTPDTDAAYEAGYNAGYAAAEPQAGAGSGYQTQPQPDPAYNQGYDYGLRDRVAGRPADPDAHVGRYDPRFRRSFESGYYEAFESRRDR